MTLRWAVPDVLGFLMNDYRQMRLHLEALSEDGFICFVGMLGSDIIILEDQVYEILNDPEEGGQRCLPPATWREKITKEMLACREEHPSEWSRICWIAKVDSDSEKQMTIASRSFWIALLALLISLVSLVWSIAAP